MSTSPILKSFRHELNHLFDKPFSVFSEIGNWYPEVDIQDDEKNYLIKANLPGLEVKDIEVYLNQGTLTIKGKIEERSSQKEKKYIRSERAYGEFSRSFHLANIDDKAETQAQFSKGVLTLTIPKTISALTQRIAIKELSEEDKKEKTKMKEEAIAVK